MPGEAVRTTPTDTISQTESDNIGIRTPKPPGPRLATAMFFSGVIFSFGPEARLLKSIQGISQTMFQKGKVKKVFFPAACIMNYYTHQKYTPPRPLFWFAVHPGPQKYSLHPIAHIKENYAQSTILNILERPTPVINPRAGIKTNHAFWLLHTRTPVKFPANTKI